MLKPAEDLETGALEACMEAYEALGWSYAVQMNSYEVYCCDDPAAAELDGFWWKQLENGQQRVIAAQGRQVLYIDYTGSADLREQSAVIAAAFPE